MVMTVATLCTGTSGLTQRASRPPAHYARLRIAGPLLAYQTNRGGERNLPGTETLALRRSPEGRQQLPLDLSDTSNVSPTQAATDTRTYFEQQQRALQDGIALQGSSGVELPGFVSDWWGSIPARSKLVAAAGSAFMLSNMDKVNMTVAVIPIAHELGWSSTITGLVQSAFFWGFLLAQIPGGYVSSSFGGRRTLPPSVLIWSAATALLPLTVGSLPALFMTRSLMGCGEAVAPSAIVDMISRTIPKEQRAGAISSAFSGLHIGSVLALLMSPVIISTFGWRSLFGAFGVMGVLWYFGFQMLMEDIGRQDPEILRLLDPASTASGSAVTGMRQARSGIARRMERRRLAAAAGEAAGSSRGSGLHIPYRAMLRSRPVQVLMFTHFAHNWLHYTMMAWLPMYFVDSLSVDLLHASQTALLPPLAGIVAAAVAGRSADWMIAAGAPVEAVRKAAQCTAFLAPAGLLTAICLRGHDAANTVDVAGATAASIASELSGDASLTVAGITLALGLSSFSLAGLYCTHGDLSPKYASAMLGVTNTAASLPGVFGVALVGIMLDQTGRSWELSLFAPSAVLLVAGAAAYTLLGSNDAVDFDEADDAPFVWEGRLLPIRRAWDSVTSVLSARRT